MSETAVDPEGVDLACLAEWMDGVGLDGGPIESAELLAGGTQNVLLRFERGDRTFVLRRPPSHKRKNSDETMRREARMLGALAGTAVPHPGLIAACPETEVLGAAFYLMEPVDGFVATTGLPEPHRSDSALRRGMGLAMVDGIAALGAVDYLAVGLGDFGKPDGYLERQVARWQSQLESYSQLEGYPGPDIPGVEEVGTWLDANRPAEFLPGIIHGDYHLANVMFRPDGPELAAIVDWELTTIGDPLLDLGWLLATWPDPKGQGAGKIGIEPWEGFPAAAELIEHYRGQTRRNVDAIEWYAVLACYKLGIILEGTHARACAGQATKEIGDTLHAQTLGLFEQALARIKRA
jgi:aminoglycoside phosphotransferase (APT) family kinase protein